VFDQKDSSGPQPVAFKRKTRRYIKNIMQGNEERKRDHSHAEDDEESDLVEEDQLAEAAVDEDLEPSLDSIPSNRRGRPKIPVT
jgi:hypothetical protein